MTYPNQPQWDPHGGQQPNPYGGQPGYPQQQPGYGQPGQQPGYPQQQPYGAPQSGPFPQQGYGYPQQPYGYGGGGPGMPGYERPAKNDWISGIILILGGVFGVLQGILPWIDSSVGDVHVNGFDIASAAGQASASDLSSSAATLIQIAIWAVFVGGIVLVLAGVVLFVPMRNRKITGALALVVSVLMGAGAIIWLTSSGEANPDSTAPGYYFFLIAGLIGVIGSIVALVRK